MTDLNFQTLSRTPRLVNRNEQMGQIHEAIFNEGDDCRLIFLQAEGGLGKSRLLEEVLWRCGNPDWLEARGESPDKDFPGWQSDNVLITDIVDFNDIQLHTNTHFMVALYKALQEGGIVS